MNKGFTIVFLIALTCNLALADGHRQGKGYGERMQRGGDPEQRMQRMQEHLGLSDSQMEQMREIREAGGGREEMRAVLTDEQRAQMDEHRARRDEMRARHREKRSEETN